ncbi:uncharacterized protein TRIADDRAFT_32203, partial [Trichoplax adhaerens]
YIRYLSKKVHHAGSAENLKLADYVKSQWESASFDDVRFQKYRALLSYPDSKNPNVVGMKDQSGTFRYRASMKEEKLHPDENDPELLAPYNAYAAKGLVEGQLIYVNYGRYSDFVALQKLNISCRGKIAIVRYGRMFRGDKPKIGQMFGCIGMIIYNDPADSAPEGYEKSYPNDWYLPYSGVQRGSVSTLLGDPETPGRPSLDSAYRNSNLSGIVSSIPVQPLSAKDAIYLLESLDGLDAPAEWRGKLPIKYKIGGSFISNMSNWVVHLAVNNELVHKDIYNVIGTIKGQIEPDRYVIVGNHRDAWNFGAIDPSSATAVMLEVSRIMGIHLKQGWRPRRTIKFCSWDAEEFALIGSTEWVEENAKELAQRAVTYINVDLAVIGNYSFAAQASPIFTKAVHEAAKRVKDPNDLTKSVYDIWSTRFPLPGTQKPFMGLLASGSDYKSFIQYVGISSINFAYVFNFVTSPLSNYPTYHTRYDTFDYIQRTLDPHFSFHASIGRMMMLLTVEFSDYPLLHINTIDYAQTIGMYFAQISAAYKPLLQSHGVTLDYLQWAIGNFTVACSRFDQSIQNIDVNDALKLRRINDQLMYLERAFIIPEGLPGRSYDKHVIMASSQIDQYNVAPFPGIVDALFIGQTQNKWEEAKIQVANAAYLIHAATKTLTVI